MGTVLDKPVDKPADILVGMPADKPADMLAGMLVDTLRDTARIRVQFRLPGKAMHSQGNLFRALPTSSSVPESHSGSLYTRFSPCCGDQR